ncbi:MAG: DUF4232 domain-containing protein [Actinobacteria bacterium]|nr:DUF4232 domain-containing protein [Actinomycetota bacterium]
MTRSVLFALAAAVLIAGCGSAANGTSGASSPTASQPAPAHTSAAATPSPATSAHASGGAGCSSSNLTIKVNTSQSGGAAGSVYYPIDFTNTSGSSCTLFGYPGVSFVTGPRASGNQIGRAADRNTSAAAATVTIPPGGDAHAVLQVVDAGNYSPSACRPVTAHWLRVYPPGETVPVYASFTSRACSADLPAKLGSPLSVYPVRGGAGMRGQAP